MIGAILKELRQNRNYTIARLCELIQMNTNTYAKYEREERDVSTETLAKFADFYGVTTDYLLGREPEKNPIAMLNLTIREKEALEMYIKLPKEVRQIIIDTMIQLGDAAKNAEHKTPKIDVTYSKIYADEGGVSKKETPAGLPKISDFFDD